MNNLESVNIYTDGACSGNPGPGGWGVLIKYQDRDVELMGGELETTNNRMEMMAAIMALESLKSVKKVNIHTDSTYLRDGITKWIIKWKANGWRTSTKKPVKNIDLWKRLEAVTALHDIEWHWVKGHAGHPENERVDRLAGIALTQKRNTNV
ncbi:MAG: ribonuclease HI [Rhodospirillaceae bacterium]|nr:ribonuclease HI [Rhodospirillaceae bacterium]|tara:strand:- start:160 stop:615 length:456 start_codon:yes stop_codon:yes gene_type:complete